MNPNDHAAKECPAKLVPRILSAANRFPLSSEARSATVVKPLPPRKPPGERSAVLAKKRRR